MEENARSQRARSAVSAGVTAQQWEHISPFVAHNEMVECAGEAQWVDYAKSHGRGSGTGVFVVSNKQVLFVMTQGVGRVSFPRKELTNFRKGWIIMPGFSQVEFNYDFGQHFVFWCTNRLAKELKNVFR